MAIIKSLEKDQTTKIAKKVYENFKEQTGSVPEWVKVMAHRPEILKEFTELFKIIMSKGVLDNYLKWKIAYVISETLKCKFCVSVTIGMLKKLGASDNLLSNIKEVQNLPEKEKEILELVKDMTLDGHLDKPEILDKLKAELTEPQLVEIVSVIGLFNYINRFNNAFIILPV
ncbi:MAG: hypothetical protein ABIJ60_02295 [Patescibacteria group bacterium]